MRLVTNNFKIFIFEILNVIHLTFDMQLGERGWLSFQLKVRSVNYKEVQKKTDTLFNHIFYKCCNFPKIVLLVVGYRYTFYCEKHC